jgi:glutamate dehydrogenase (NAD(P)+)
LLSAICSDGHRAQNNHASGSFKGGVRFHLSVNLGEIRALAQIMTWKFALVDIPFGCAKGGIAVDTNQISPIALETLTKYLVQKMAPVLAVHQGIPAPDVGTNPQVMAWILEQYDKNHSYFPRFIGRRSCSAGGVCYRH